MGELSLVASPSQSSWCFLFFCDFLGAPSNRPDKKISDFCQPVSFLCLVEKGLKRRRMDLAESCSPSLPLIGGGLGFNERIR